MTALPWKPDLELDGGLARWITEASGATIDGALEVAAGLAALPVEPEAIEVIRRAQPLQGTAALDANSAVAGLHPSAPGQLNATVARSDAERTVATAAKRE
jgi:hypothetical protein